MRILFGDKEAYLDKFKTACRTRPIETQILGTSYYMKEHTKPLFHKNKILAVWWCGGVVVIRSPHDPEVPSSNPGKNNTSDFSIRDPLSLPSCDWYRIYLAMWWNSSVGRAADLIYTCQVRCHGFDSRCFPHI